MWSDFDYTWLGEEAVVKAGAHTTSVQRENIQFTEENVIYVMFNLSQNS